MVVQHNVVSSEFLLLPLPEVQEMDLVEFIPTTTCVAYSVSSSLHYTTCSSSVRMFSSSSSTSSLGLVAHENNFFALPDDQEMNFDEIIPTTSSLSSSFAVCVSSMVVLVVGLVALIQIAFVVIALPILSFSPASSQPLPPTPSSSSSPFSRTSSFVFVCFFVGLVAHIKSLNALPVEKSMELDEFNLAKTLL